MKVCSRCKVEKPYDQFSKYAKSKDGYQYHCRQCKAELHKENHAARMVSIRAAKKRRKARNRQYVYDYLLEHPCPCGESDPVVLEFDHIDPSIKSKAISVLMNEACSLEMLQGEIAKCRVLCANCHRRHTAKQFGWWIDGQAFVELDTLTATAYTE